MQFKVVIALGLGIAAVAACSSSGGNNTLSGDPSSSGGTASNDADGGCPSMGTTPSDGQGYVQTEGCETCHGANLAGSTTPLVSGAEPGLVIPAGTYLYPPNLTPDTSTGIGAWSDGQINQAITEGIDNEGLDLCPEMGRHYPNMCPDEVTGIIAYLRSIPAVAHKVPGSICPPLKTGTPPEDGG
jgi:hypothetical protein